MRDTLRRWADDVMQPAAREADDRSAPPDDFLETFSDLGAIAMAVPEGLRRGRRGGVGGVSQMLIAEDLATRGYGPCVCGAVAVVFRERDRSLGR